MRSVVPYIEYFDEESNSNYFRVNILLAKRLRFLKARIHQDSEGGIVPKITRSYAYLVPSSKSMFQTNRSEDPGFELLRQRTSQSTSRKSTVTGYIY